MVRKSISLLLSLIMVFSALIVIPLQASAEDVFEPENSVEETAADESVDDSAVAVEKKVELAEQGADAEITESGANADITQTGGMTLEQLKAKFPQNAYWNHKIQSGHGFVGEFIHVGPCNNPDGYSWTPCYSHTSSSIPIGEYDCNEFGGALQCAGFARKIAYDVYGTYYTNWGTGSIWNCKAGDVVKYGVTSSNQYGHTVMIVERNGNEVTLGECNYASRCMISWNRTVNIGSFSGGITCYIAPSVLPTYEYSTPVLTSVESTAEGLKVNWNRIKNVPKYTVYYKSDDVQNWKQLATTVANGYIFKKAVYKKSYTFTVRCRNSNGEIASDFDRNGITGTYRFVPQITAKATKGKITVSWDKMATAAKYRLYIKGGKTKEYAKLLDTTKTSAVFSVGQNGVTYTFSVRCMDANKNFISDRKEKGASAKFISLTSLLVTPKIKKLQNVSNGVKLTWGAVKGAAKYRVFIKSGGRWVKLCDTKSTSYTYTKAKSGTTYCFTVRCISSNGKTYTSSYSSSGWKIRFIAMPKIKKLKSATNGVNLTWGASKGAAKYRVLIKIGTKWKKLADTTKTTYTHTGAKSGKKYTYSVICITANAKSATSAYYTKGWSITYKKPVDWKNLYKNYVNSHLNSMPWGSSTFKVGSSTPFIMHDLDMNGIPELLVGSIGNHLSVQVYTIYGGKVVYAGGLGGRSVDYSTNKSYHGVFCWYVNGIGGSGGLGYYAVSKGKLSKKDVMVYSYNQNTKKRSETVKNQTLYSVYKNSTKNLNEYSWSDIQSNGWNAFFKKFGY